MTRTDITQQIAQTSLIALCAFSICSTVFGRSPGGPEPQQPEMMPGGLPIPLTAIPLAFAIGSAEALHIPGPATLSLLEDLGWGSGGDTCSLTKPTLVAPSGSTSSTPTYTWNAVSGAEQYQLWVEDSSAKPKINQWYKASEVGCTSGTGTCSVAPSTPLTSGAAKFYVRAWASCNGGTYSDWSDPMNFTVGAGGTTSATVLQLWSVTGATVGGTSTLWAQVQNTGSSALPSNAVVWF